MINFLTSSLVTVPAERDSAYIDSVSLGIDPSFDMHKKYLEQLCQDFESKVKDMITESIAEHKAAETENVVYVEVAQHMLFCKRKIAAVCRRESTLKVQSEAWSPYISLKRVSGRTF